MTITLAWWQIGVLILLTLILAAILNVLATLIVSGLSRLWSAIKHKQTLRHLIRSWKEQESTEHGKGFDHHWNGLDYNQIQNEGFDINLPFGGGVPSENVYQSTPYEMPDEQSIAQRFQMGYAKGDLIQLKESNDYQAEISHDNGKTWEPYDLPAQEPYKVIECRRDGEYYGASGFSPGGVSFVQPVQKAPKIKWRKRIGETINFKKGRTK